MRFLSMGCLAIGAITVRKARAFHIINPLQLPCSKIHDTCFSLYISTLFVQNVSQLFFVKSHFILSVAIKIIMLDPRKDRFLSEEPLFMPGIAN